MTLKELDKKIEKTVWALEDAFKQSLVTEAVTLRIAYLHTLTTLRISMITTEGTT